MLLFSQIKRKPGINYFQLKEYENKQIISRNYIFYFRLQSTHGIANLQARIAPKASSAATDAAQALNDPPSYPPPPPPPSANKEENVELVIS